MQLVLVRYALLVAAVVVLNFALPRLLPGDPLSGAAENGLGGVVPALTTQQAAQLRATYHLDQPLPLQFTSYLTDLLRGDLGWSLSHSAPHAFECTTIARSFVDCGKRWNRYGRCSRTQLNQPGAMPASGARMRSTNVRSPNRSRGSQSMGRRDTRCTFAPAS